MPAPIYYGGQAVLEGVMIRGPQHFSIAVRNPMGRIVIHTERLSGVYTGTLRKIPLVRGAIVLYETMALGLRALAFSSRIAMEVEPPPGADPDEKTEFPEKAFWGTMVLSFVLVVGIFFAAPILL